MRRRRKVQVLADKMMEFMSTRSWQQYLDFFMIKAWENEKRGPMLIGRETFHRPGEAKPFLVKNNTTVVHGRIWALERALGVRPTGGEAAVFGSEINAQTTHNNNFPETGSDQLPYNNSLLGFQNCGGRSPAVATVTNPNDESMHHPKPFRVAWGSST